MKFDRQKLLQGINYKLKKEKIEQNIKEEKNEQKPIQLQTVEKMQNLIDTSESLLIWQETQMIRDYMRKNNIQIQGKNVNTPYMDFNNKFMKENFDNILIDYLIQLKEKFKMTPIQQFSLSNFNMEQNQIYVSPTGSGKTLSYLIPLINTILKEQNKTINIILCPTFETSAQVYKETMKIVNFIKKDIKIGHIQNMKFEINEYQILICTPQKLIQNLDNFQNQTSRLIVDEFDQFFQDSFYEQIQLIFDKLRADKTQLYLYSATYPLKIKDLLKEEFIEIIIGGRVRVLNKISQVLKYVDTEEGKIIELEQLLNNGKIDFPCIIFLQDKQWVYQIFKILKERLKYIDYLDSNLNLFQREEKINKFLNGEINFLITTDILARGFDFLNLKMVINFDMPLDSVQFIHRAGRTGWAGQQGQVITFFTKEDVPLVRKMAEMLKESKCDIPEWIYSIKKQGKNQIRKVQKKAQKRERIQNLSKFN